MTKGSYILVLNLNEAGSIAIGALGTLYFLEGNYAYAGSALNGLEYRIGRHFTQVKKLRWHIDYLLQHAKVVKAFFLPSDIRMECFLNRLVSMLPDSIPVNGFGASDCRCRTHLHRISKEDLQHLQQLFGEELTTQGGFTRSA